LPEIRRYCVSYCPLTDRSEPERPVIRHRRSPPRDLADHLDQASCLWIRIGILDSPREGMNMSQGTSHHFLIMHRLIGALAVVTFAVGAAIAFFVTTAKPATAHADVALHHFCNFTFENGTKIRAYTWENDGTTYKVFRLQQPRSDQWKREGITHDSVTVSSCAKVP
jgi:hypothetical protein